MNECHRKFREYLIGLTFTRSILNITSKILRLMLEIVYISCRLMYFVFSQEDKHETNNAGLDNYYYNEFRRW